MEIFSTKLSLNQLPNRIDGDSPDIEKLSKQKRFKYEFRTPKDYLSLLTLLTVVSGYLI